MERRKVGVGASFLVVGNAVSSILKFLSIPILARQLTPEDFGAAGVALAISSLGLILAGRSGLGTCVVNFQNERKVFDDTIFWIGLALGLILMVLFLVGAGSLAVLFGSRNATDLILVISIIFPMDVLSGVGYAFLLRANRYQTISAINIIASAMSIITALLLALFGAGAWSLIAQFIVFSLVRVNSFFILSGYRISCSFSISAAKRIVPRALNFTISDVFIWAANDGPILIVSKFLGEAAAGVFRVTNRLVRLPFEIIGIQLSDAFFSGLSDRNGASSENSDILWIQKIAATILAPIFLGLAAVSQVATVVILGEQYKEFWVIVSLLCIAQAFNVINFGFFPYLKANAFSSFLLMMTATRAILVVLGATVGAIVFGKLWGFTCGLALSYFITSVIYFMCFCWKSRIQPATLFGAQVVPMLGSVFMGISVFYLLDIILSEHGGFLTLLIASTFGSVFYLAFIWIFERSLVWDLLKIVRSKR